MLLNSSHNYAQEEKSFKIAVSSKGMLVLDQLSSGVSCKWSESSDLENYDEIRLLKQMPIGCALSESENAVFFCEKFQEKIEGVDPGAPKNPKIAKKFFITTIITSIIFIVIYYLVKIDLLNLREYLQ